LTPLSAVCCGHTVCGYTAEFCLFVCIEM